MIKQMFPFIMILQACAVTSPPPPMATVQVQMVPAIPAQSGAIYSSTHTMFLFEDKKARDVGDLITVTLTEKTNASASQTTSTARSSDVTVPAPTLFGGAVTKNGRSILEQELSNESGFDASGNLSQSNQLSGNITATVVSRLPNGNLVIQGEKWLQLSQGSELVRIQGIVRPADIAPDNTIASSRVAEARISYSGHGAVAKANAQGWFAKFFQVINPF